MDDVSYYDDGMAVTMEVQGVMTLVIKDTSWAPKLITKLHRTITTMTGVMTDMVIETQNEK